MHVITRTLFSGLLYLILTAILLPSLSHAVESANTSLSVAEEIVDVALLAAESGNLSEAEKHYQQFNARWLDIEGEIKQHSGQAYKDIETNMGKVSYAFMQNKTAAVVKALQGLQQVNNAFTQGNYQADVAFKQVDLSLADFLGLLDVTEQAVVSKQKQSASDAIAKVRDSWLSVEGVVVAQSATVYNATERDMVTVDAMINEGDFSGATDILVQMKTYLMPLAGKTAYSLWDAAMIPIREGLEALLVVGALLAFTNKAKQKKGSRWIWAGVGAGIVVSIVLALIIKLIFSYSAFSHNNFLIAGCTGVFAAVMLLYMSYWLHSKSNVNEWNRYIADKSTNALVTGRFFSLAFLAFLAVFREGTETMLFIIGMINQISFQDLLTGLAVGCGVLAVIAYLMLFVGMKLPIRAFFMVSSLIVFYLCIKFTGLGVHSLQLAGWLPSTHMRALPSIDFIGFYPSLESAVPQLLIALSALLVVIWNYIRPSFNKMTIKESLK